MFWSSSKNSGIYSWPATPEEAEAAGVWLSAMRGAAQAEATRRRLRTKRLFIVLNIYISP
jgi:hypothetical protein